MAEFEVQTNTVTEEWISRKWRPAMGWVYMAICVFDFVLFPILWSLSQAFFDGEIRNQWNPITLQGAGLFHLAMGAVLGITAYGRTKEKLGGISPMSMNNHYESRYNKYQEYERDEEYNNDGFQYRRTTTKVKRPFTGGATRIPRELLNDE